MIVHHMCARSERQYRDRERERKQHYFIPCVNNEAILVLHTRRLKTWHTTILRKYTV